MNLTISPAAVRKSVYVQASPQKAFDVFTAGMGRWWLKSHSINKSPIAEVIMEPFNGGRWFERGEDGSECPWGKVLVWEPPRRLVLGWQTDGTRVDLEHRNLERFGEHATKIREALDSSGGWSGLLQAYANAIPR